MPPWLTHKQLLTGYTISSSSKAWFSAYACNVMQDPKHEFQPCHCPLLAYVAFLALHVLHCVRLETVLCPLTGSCINSTGTKISDLGRHNNHRRTISEVAELLVATTYRKLLCNNKSKMTDNTSLERDDSAKS